jgi:hypothetical protein
VLQRETGLIDAVKLPADEAISAPPLLAFHPWPVLLAFERHVYTVEQESMWLALDGKNALEAEDNRPLITLSSPTTHRFTSSRSTSPDTSKPAVEIPWLWSRLGRRQPLLEQIESWWLRCADTDVCILASKLGQAFQHVLGAERADTETTCFSNSTSARSHSTAAAMGFGSRTAAATTARPLICTDEVNLVGDNSIGEAHLSGYKILIAVQLSESHTTTCGCSSGFDCLLHAGAPTTAASIAVTPTAAARVAFANRLARWC